MDNRFRFIPTDLEALFVFDYVPIGDNRGSLERLFCTDSFKVHQVNKPIVQINRTSTKFAGTVRGLHFQHPPYIETKIVICLKGTIMDVAVDIRTHSITFLSSHSEILSGENKKGMLIPEGFAHGFQALTDNCELLYLHTSTYQPNAEDGINVRDPKLLIDWQLPITNLSERDRSFQYINDSFSGLAI